MEVDWSAIVISVGLAIIIFSLIELLSRRRGHDYDEYDD